jgi:UDP-N-acetyl-D-glucosamine dehydrogenase
MNLIEKIDNRSARIGVIGLGYVGLPLAMEFANAGYKVTGIDIDQNKINSLNDGKNYIKDVNDESLKNAVEKGLLKGTTDFSIVKELDTISICVPTPLNKEKNPNISHIVSVMNGIKDHLHSNMLIVLESTTYPGSTKELILPYISENKSLILGENIYLCFSPERIDPGNSIYRTSNTPKIIGGIIKKCADVGKSLYTKIIDKVIIVSSTETAEMVKLLENTFRAINIGLANEMAIMCEKLGVNVWEVIDAAETKPFGFMRFNPGPGLGGHCIPIDPYYLSWKLKTLDYDARFIKLAGEINTNMPRHIIDLISKSLNNKKKSINGSKILIIGVAYKKNVNDYRESPALDIIELLRKLGSEIQYFDPHVDKLKYNKIILKSLTHINKKILNSYDACVVLTDHSGINYKLISENNRIIIDTRNAFKNIQGKHITRLGEG